jgi:hypothetical protein
MAGMHLLERMVKDIKWLLSEEGDSGQEEAIYLWDDKRGTVPNATGYGKSEEER